MSKSLKIKLITFITILIFAILGFNNMSFAASFSASAKNTQLNVGDTTTLTISATDCGGRFTISSSDPNVVSVSSGAEWIENTSLSITLTAKKAGTATITVVPFDVSDTAGENQMDPKDDRKVNITVKEKVVTPPPAQNSKSTDATLKSITVGGKTYNNPKTDITVASVSADTSSIKIEAQTNNSKATVTGVGNKDLKAGTTNTFTLKVTAESGATQNYIVRVPRLAQDDSKPNVIEEKEEEEPEEEIKVLLKSLAIKGVISEEEEKIDLALTPEFSGEVYEYTLTIPPEQNEITKLDVEAIGAQEDFTIEITGNEELVDGENTVTILVKSKDGEKTATYQILVVKQPKEVEAVAVAAPVETTQIPQEVEQELSIPKILIAVFTSIIAIAGIVFGVIEYRYSKNKNGEFSSIPYANIGFDSENDENDKEDILGEFKEDNEKNEEIESISKNDTEEEFEVLGEEEKKPKKRGKHF